MVKVGLLWHHLQNKYVLFQLTYHEDKTDEKKASLIWKQNLLINAEFFGCIKNFVCFISCKLAYHSFKETVLVNLKYCTSALVKGEGDLTVCFKTSLYM